MSAPRAARDVIYKVCNGRIERSGHDSEIGDNRKALLGARVGALATRNSSNYAEHLLSLTQWWSMVSLLQATQVVSTHSPRQSGPHTTRGELYEALSGLQHH